MSIQRLAGGLALVAMVGACERQPFEPQQVSAGPQFDIIDPLYAVVTDLNGNEVDQLEVRVGADITLVGIACGGYIPYSYAWFAGTLEVGTNYSLEYAFTDPGDYTITIKVHDAIGQEATDQVLVHVLPNTITVAIDIKPGSFPNSLNLGANGTVPVAIFGSATFDATTVDPLTVTLAGAGVKLKGQGTPMASVSDVNGDGFPDLVVHVETQALQLTEGDSEAVLHGWTVDGKEIEGRDAIRVVP